MRIATRKGGVLASLTILYTHDRCLVVSERGWFQWVFYQYVASHLTVAQEDGVLVANVKGTIRRIT